MLRQWFRNSDRYGKHARYHAASDRWVETGSALCGRSIAHPGYTLTRDVMAVPDYVPICRQCLKRSSQGMH